ncbi:MAG: RluA family pseudouridine synthase [Candidatus Limivivens sp.]|nr:RluA family pseudouridine synthase [Candidatus Limivivens sp.]
MKTEPHILFEDQEILVCEKPAGVPVESARIGTADMVSILRNYLAAKPEVSGIPYVGLVHRLDQPVQGVMVFAKTKKSAANLSAQVSGGRMKKIYQAVVEGNPPEESGQLTDWLFKNGKTNTSEIVKEGTKGAKKAMLNYRVLERRDGRALVEVELLTGRHHQIRVQMAGAGMPLAGDRKYGKADNLPEQKMPDKAGDGMPSVLEHVALCAVRLTFCHPKTGKELTFTCKPDFSIQ